jgi:tetratricopeptide (TPR) repeat protein
LGHSYRELNRLDKAILTYRQWLELDPNSSTAWMHLGLVYRDSGDLDEAERCLTEAIRCSPEKAEIHAVLGALYLMKNFPERAVTTLRDAIGLDPNLALAHANISLAFGEMGRLEEAEDSYSIAVDLGYADANMLRAKLNHLAKAE